MLVSPTQNSGVGGMPNANPRSRYFASQWNIGFSLLGTRLFQNTLCAHCMTRIRGVNRGDRRYDLKRSSVKFFCLDLVTRKCSTACESSKVNDFASAFVLLIKENSM